MEPHADSLDRSLADRKRLIRTIHSRYAAYRSFTGWYLAEEVSDSLAPAQVGRLRALFLGSRANECKALRNQPVAFAPYFSESSSARQNADHYQELLDGAGIDVVMLSEDGVGSAVLGSRSRAADRAFFPNVPGAMQAGVLRSGATLNVSSASTLARKSTLSRQRRPA